VLGVSAGFYYWLAQPPPKEDPYADSYRAIRFQDKPAWIEAEDVDVARMQFVDPDGKVITPAQCAGSRSIMVVITRGNTQVPCVYCSTQTSRLIYQYEEFQKRSAEVLVVYPVQAGPDAAALERFLKVTREELGDPAGKVPFPIVFDTQLKAVDQLGIRDHLSKPATYILDKHGQVRFAYVGSTIADRPSIKAMLAQLDTLNRETP
jgi:peroxiredoxin